MTQDQLTRLHQRHVAQVNALLEEIKNYPDEVLNRTPPDGGWSAIQTLTHLILSEESALAYVHKKLGLTQHFERAGLGSKWRSFLLWLALVSPFKFKAPTVVSRENLPAYATRADTQARWQKALEGWSVFFASLPPSLLDKAVFKHPKAGKIGWDDMLGFFTTHCARHHQQIRRAVR